MSLWLGLDLESTGLAVKEDRITEVGAVLWDHRAKKPVKIFHEFCKIDKELSKEIVELTGITDEILLKFGKPFKTVAESLGEMFKHCTHVVCHNGTGFDRPIFEAECVRHNVAKWDRPWIDTSVDVPFPPNITVRKLSYLACEHGFVNPFAHRAVFDVMTMLKVLSCYDADEILRYAASPNLTIQAKVEYADRQKASSRGYRWNGETKQWLKTIKEFQLEKERAEAMFTVAVLEKGV